jgi:MFS family permease
MNELLEPAEHPRLIEAPPPPAPPETPPAPLPTATARPPLWRNRDYMLLWSGQVVSTLGVTVTQIALPLLILAITGSPQVAGLAAGLSILPYVLFGLPAGALVDRWDRKRVMLLCDLGRAINIATIPLALAFGALTIWQIYVVAFIEGTLLVFFDLAEVAALPQVVRREQLADATGQNQATFALAGLIGPALGGFLYGLGRALPFVTDAVSYLASVGTLLLIRTRFQDERAASAAPRNLRAEIGEGLRWLWHHPTIRFLAALTGGLNFTTSSFALLVIISAQRQGADDLTIGLIFSVGSVGTLLGSLLGGRIKRRFPFGPILIVCMWVSTSAMLLYAFNPPLLLLGAITALFLFTFPIYSVAMISYRLPLIPDALQGRVNSVFRIIAFGMNVPGAALGGLLLEQIGVTQTVLVFAGCLTVLSLLATLHPTVRGARWTAEHTG